MSAPIRAPRHVATGSRPRTREAHRIISLPTGELQALIAGAVEHALERRQAEGVPAIALPTMKAAKALGVCHDVFKREIAPELKCIRLNRKPLYPVAELQRWAERNAERTL